MPFNRLNHDILGEIRPRFQLKISCEPEVALDQLAKRVVSDNSVSGYRSEHLMYLKTPSWIRHYWSPEMTVRIEHEEFMDHPTVSCLIGPRQSVWAMFALIYAAVALLSIFGGIFAWVQYQQGGSGFLLWIFPSGIFLFSSIFLTAKLGQHKGRDQMLHLVSFVYHSLAEITEVERYERK